MFNKSPYLKRKSHVKYGPLGKYQTYGSVRHASLLYSQIFLMLSGPAFTLTNLVTILV